MSKPTSIFDQISEVQSKLSELRKDRDRYRTLNKDLERRLAFAEERLKRLDGTSEDKPALSERDLRWLVLRQATVRFVSHLEGPDKVTVSARGKKRGVAGDLKEALKQARKSLPL